MTKFVIFKQAASCHFYLHTSAFTFSVLSVFVYSDKETSFLVSFTKGKKSWFFVETETEVASDFVNFKGKMRQLSYFDN